MISSPIVKMALKAAFRDKLFIAAFLILLCSSLVSVFFGSAAIIEQDQFTAAYMAASLRIVSALALILAICFYIRRLFDDRLIEYLLSRPISKVSLVLSHVCAYFLLALPITFLVALPVLWISQNLSDNMTWLWLLTIYIELVIVSCASVFFSMVIKSSFGACLAAISFYTFARIVGELLGIVHANITSPLMGLLSKLFEFVTIVVPRLDLLGQSSWLIYGNASLNEIGFVILHGALFIVLIIIASCIDLYRKQF